MSVSTVNEGRQPGLAPGHNVGVLRGQATVRSRLKAGRVG